MEIKSYELLLKNWKKRKYSLQIKLQNSYGYKKEWFKRAIRIINDRIKYYNKKLIKTQ